MNVEKLREQLKIDEGCVYEIYNDHLGYPTFGIGHLVVEGDPEHGQPVGTPVDNERVRQVFALDIASTLDECHVLYPDFDDLLQEFAGRVLSPLKQTE